MWLAMCEPHADFELWWGQGGLPIAPLDGARADAEGNVTLSADHAAAAGWVVTGYKGGRFEERVFISGWETLDHDFQSGVADARLPADAFSLRFEGWLSVERPGEHTFELSSDDGSRLFIHDELVLNHWGWHAMSTATARVRLDPGLHRLRIEYQELDGWAGIKFRYAPPGGALTHDVPVRRTPSPLTGIEFFGVQVDPLGNRSSFTTPIHGAGQE